MKESEEVLRAVLAATRKQRDEAELEVKRLSKLLSKAYAELHKQLPAMRVVFDYETIDAVKAYYKK